MVYRQWWRLVEGNCFWSCHTCGSSLPPLPTHTQHIFLVDQSTIRSSVFSFISPPPRPKTPRGQVISTATYPLFIDKSLAILLYTTNGIRRVLKHQSDLGSTGIYSYCARRWNSRVWTILFGNHHYTSGLLVLELSPRLPRLCSNFSPLRMIYKYISGIAQCRYIIYHDV